MPEIANLWPKPESSSIASLQNAELMAESQDLDLERGSCSQCRARPGEQGYQHVTHGSGRFQDEVPRATISIAMKFLVGTGSETHKSNEISWDGVFAEHEPNKP